MAKNVPSSLHRLGIVKFLSRREHDISLWNTEEDARWRELMSVGNDGIISSAAIIQGLLSGGATGSEAVIGVTALVMIGMVGTGASVYSEEASERNADLRIAEEEQAAITAKPEDEYLELVQIYQEKGLSPQLSEAVARELMDKDPLRAQLDEEYDLEELPSRWFPWKKALLAAGAFLLGSVLPLIFLLLLPWSIRGEVTFVSVMVALAISGWIGHWVEHTTPWRSMLRTMLVGAIILGISTFAGSLVTF